MSEPLFSRSEKDDSFKYAQTIVDYFTCCARRLSPMLSAYCLIMQECGIQADDPISVAGASIAYDIDAGIGAGAENAYHNSQHLCEVLVCTFALGQTTALSQRELALVHLAALIHDFHHDGGQNTHPFRLEKIAIDRASPYLENAGISKEEQKLLLALVLATEFDEGTAYARACFAFHFEEGTEPDIEIAETALSILKKNRSASLQAMILIEADILPSVGLTVRHAIMVSQRLEEEWGITFNAQSKVDFIEDAITNSKISQFYWPNMRTIRDQYLLRLD